MVTKSHSKESLPFSYQGYSSPIYTKSITKSLDIFSCDGTKLVVEITLPMSSLEETPLEKFPAILLASNSERRNLNDAEIKLGHDLVSYGYVFVVVELRDCGVVNGNDSFGGIEHCKDVISTSEWIASQQWYNGKIGLLNSSDQQLQFISQLESGTIDQLAHFMDYGGTVFLGPWTHSGSIIEKSDYPGGTVNQLEAYCRWYDFTLKGVDNGFDQSPAVTYYMFNAEPGKEWRFSESWPPENEVRTKLYLSATASNTIASAHDGTLTPNHPCDATTTTYKLRGDLTTLREEQLSFTSAPLFPYYLNEMAGCVSVNLWVSCTSKDVDFIVSMEEILSDGTSRNIKDGVMKASHRTVTPNSAWEKMGATWHASITDDVTKCLEEGLNNPTLLQFAIDPIAYHFSFNSRIRFTITCANATNQPNRNQDELPELTLYTGGAFSSYISIPFLEQSYQTYNGTTTLDSKTLPATLYAFTNHYYLYSAGYWHKFKTSDAYTISGNHVIFDNGNLIFQPMGAPLGITSMPDARMDQGTPHPFPAFRKHFIASEKVAARDYTLFVPGHKNLYLDVFKQPCSEPAPCIIFIHGYGSPYAYLTQQLLMMYQNGYAVAAIDLRNYPPNEFPDYIHDAKGAIRYLRANAATFGIDPDLFGMYGFSLGGNTTLMVALTGDLPILEGTVGGNTQYSSRIQAAVAGFAWSDLLYMGKDIAEEFEYDPKLQADRVRMTDGEFSPSSEVIGFSGPGKGLKVLREYKENGCKPSNELFDQKLKEAAFASPVNYANPSVPPIALFGGYGMEYINIAFKQSLRTFDALNKVDALTFLYGNTNGEYGDKPETLSAIKAFFDEQLINGGNRHVLAISADSDIVVIDYVSRRIQNKTYIENNRFLILANDLKPFLTQMTAPSYEIENDYINLFSLAGDNVTSKYYEKYRTIVFKIK